MLIFRKLLLLIFAILLVSCHATKPIVRTTKPVVYVPAKKPIVKVITETKVIKDTVKTIVSNPKIEILEATTRVRVTTEMVVSYIEKYKQIAMNDMSKFGIPASITLSQAILESGAGTGPLSVQGNNHFGIKCHKDWTGDSIKHDDDEADECFRKYENPNQSFDDHSLFLLNRPWYAKLFKLEKDDYKSWAKGLKTAGYATDVKYPDKLIGIIEKYQLYQYDNQVLGKPTQEITKDFDVEIEKPKPIIVTYENSYEVAPKDTLYSVSKKFNLTIDDLKKFNNLETNELTIGQILKIK